MSLQQCQDSDNKFRFIFSIFHRFSPFCHPNNKWGQFYWIWALEMSPGDFLDSFFPAVECKLPLRDLTFGQNKIIVIVHNSNDPRNCLVYSVISSRDTNTDIALLEPVTRTIAICERIRNCLLPNCPHVKRSNAIHVRIFSIAVTCEPDIRQWCRDSIVSILMTGPRDPPSLTSSGSAPAIVLTDHYL